MNGWDLLQVILMMGAFIGIAEMVEDARKQRKKDRENGINKKFWEY